MTVERVTVNGSTELRWGRIGADADPWVLYMTGEFAFKWNDSRYGLHVSM